MPPGVAGCMEDFESHIPHLTVLPGQEYRRRRVVGTEHTENIRGVSRSPGAPANDYRRLSSTFLCFPSSVDMAGCDDIFDGCVCLCFLQQVMVSGRIWKRPSRLLVRNQITEMLKFSTSICLIITMSSPTTSGIIILYPPAITRYPGCQVSGVRAGFGRKSRKCTAGT
jgi:hypothetical protein